MNILTESAIVVNQVGKVADKIDERGIFIVLAAVVVAMFIILFLSMIAIMYFLISKFMRSMEKGIIDLKEEYKKGVLAFAEPLKDLYEVIGKHHEHTEVTMADSCNRIKDSIDYMREKIECTKEIDHSLFEVIASKTFHTFIYDIERDMNKIVDRNNLVTLKSVIVGTPVFLEGVTTNNGEIMNKIDFRYGEHKKDLESLPYNTEIMRKMFGNIASLRLELNTELCNCFDVQTGYDKDLLKRNIENVLFKFRTKIIKAIKSSIAVYK